ncbi:MAG: N-formylglutamate amidohydrolase [Myxococcota bacterium]
MSALVQVGRIGPSTALFVAPHAFAPLEAAIGWIEDDPAIRAAFAERVDDWHDLGTLEALDAATARARAPGLRTSVPRALVDLNRGWRGREEKVETLFGKGAVDAWVRQHLRVGAQEEVEEWYRAALAEVRAAAAGARVLVELHSYGDLGSTYDRNSGGRPMLRPEASVVYGAPWATAYPVGLSRLVPASLRGTRWQMEARLGAALAVHGIELGPSPYPILLPWNLSARFLAERWFRWLGASGRLPERTAARLADLAWTDEQAEVVDELPGAAGLATELTAWSHHGAELVAAFHEQDGSGTLGVELRIDLRDRAPAFGEAVAEAVVPPER